MASYEPQPGKCGHMLFDGSGRYCTNGAGAGTEHKGYGHCKKHGGTNATGDKHGKRLMAEATVVAIMPDEVLPVRDPETRLAQLLGEMWAWKDACLSALDDRDLVVETKHGPKVSPYVEMYERAVDRCARSAAEVVKIGLTERLVRLEEGEARRIMVALERVLSAKGVWDDDTRALLAAELVAIEG